MPHIQVFQAFRQDLTRRGGIACLVATLVQFGTGLDVGWWSLMIGHPYFNVAFGDDLVLDPQTGLSVGKKLSTDQVSLGTALPNVCIMLGALSAGVLSNRLGRKRTFAITALIIAIGVTVQMTCSVSGTRYWQMIGGKFVLSLGVGLGIVNSNLYVTEIAPSTIRGALVNGNPFLQGLGQLVSLCVVYGVLSNTTSATWLVPIGCQYFTPALILIAYPFLLESPRWLVEQGRADVARTNLALLGNGRLGFDVDKELADIQTAFEAKNVRGHASIKSVFAKRHRKRTFISVMTWALNGAQGYAFLASYLVLLMFQLSINEPYKVFLGLVGLLQVTSLVPFLTQDYLGRRTLLLAGSAGMCLMMMIIGILGSIVFTPAVGKAILGIKKLLSRIWHRSSSPGHFVVVIWFLIYQQTWFGATYTLAFEVPALELRDYTTSLAGASNSFTVLMVTIITPYIQDADHANLGFKIGYIYAVVSLLAFFFVFFFVPDLKGRTLEQVDWLFDHDVQARQMGSCKIPRFGGSESLGSNTASGEVSRDAKAEVVMCEDIGRK